MSRVLLLNLSSAIVLSAQMSCYIIFCLVIAALSYIRRRPNVIHCFNSQLWNFIRTLTTSDESNRNAISYLVKFWLFMKQNFRGRTKVKLVTFQNIAHFIQQYIWYWKHSSTIHQILIYVRHLRTVCIVKCLEVIR